jgi:Arc/MetJ family transcription regulator
MRTNIDIDDALMAEAQLVSGLSTKKAVVEEALRLLVRVHGQKGILGLAGKVRWTGNLEESREGRNTR